MVRDTDGNPFDTGAPVLVVAGTLKGKSGTAEDLNVSPSGAETITERQADGGRFKTLARNVKRSQSLA